MLSIGDMARALVLQTQQVRLRQEMDTLAGEVSTGIVADKATHLGGDTSALMALDRGLARLDVFRINTAEAALVTGSMQTALDQIQDRTEQISQTLIAADLTPSSSLLDTMSRNAAEGLDQVLGELNRTVAGRFLFSGTATNTPAIDNADTLLADLRTALTGQTDQAGVQAVLDSWFDTPAGDFETSTYTGSDTGIAPLQLSESESASVDVRADDAAFREVLKPLVMAALATDDSLGFSVDLQSDLLVQAGRDLLFAQEPLVEIRAGLGALEARIEETTARNSAERTASSLARLELVATDPYETATRFEAVRGQLESLYAITARSSRLSLAEYLR